MPFTGLRDGDTRAAQACLSCKRRKRKCDRALPSCAYCGSRNQACYYHEARGVGFLTPRAECFFSAFFLDHNYFTSSSLELPQVSLQLPPYVLTEIGDLGHQRIIALQYFSTVHLWMPIISKRRFFSLFSDPPSAQRTDMGFLCLAMKLVVWTPSATSPDPRTTTYLAAKQLLYTCDLSLTLTLSTLQAYILMAVYEIGHAIYPAAHLSIGACVNYATALGLGWATPSWLEGRLSWIEAEERRRVWWAIVILERYISLGWQQRPIVSEPPGMDEMLPIDDAAFDEEVMVPGYSMIASTPCSISMGRFARLAQATYLLDRVLRHTQDRTLSAESREEEAIQLDRSLSALLTFTANETERRGIKICSQAALCQSALAILHVPYLSPDSNASGHRRSIARDAMNRLSEEFFHESDRILHGSGLPFEATSPFTFHWGYEASLHLTRLSQDNPASSAILARETVHAALKMGNARWRLAGAYVDILEVQTAIDRPQAKAN
ncbi:hypothetical protein BDW68DRAFT_170151 [Aspergillus falconensis]